MARLKQRKSWFRYLASLIAAALLVAACTSNGDGDAPPTTSPTDDPSVTTAPPGPSDEPVELTVWTFGEVFLPADGFASVTDNYPNITINVESYAPSDSVQAFQRVWGTGNEPDIIQAYNDYIGVLAENGQLYDMTDLFATWAEEEPETHDNLLPVNLDMASWRDGGPYGVVIHIFPQFFTYRSDWYEAEDLSHPPETWDEVLDASRVFAADGNIGFALVGDRNQDPETWFTAMGYYMGMEDDDGFPQLTSPGGVYFIDWFLTVASEGLTSPEASTWGSGEQRSSFAEGVSAHISASRTQAMVWHTQLGNYGETWSIYQPPMQRSAGEPVDGRHVSRGGPFVVSANTDHPYEVSLLLRALLEPENLRSTYLENRIETQAVSINADPEIPTTFPWVPDLVALDEELVLFPASVRQIEVSEVMKDLLQEVLSAPAGADAAEIAARYQEEIDAIASR